MILLKKVINKHKFERIKNNKRTFFCSAVLCNLNDKTGQYKKAMVAFLLDNHLYIAKPIGVWPHTTYEYYAYFIGSIGNVHYRADSISFFKIELANSQ